LWKEGGHTMKEYTLNIPDNTGISEDKIKEYLLAKLYEDDIFSAGFCALILGIDKQDFIRTLGKNEVIYLATE
jgi:hypothetical protein